MSIAQRGYRFKSAGSGTEYNLIVGIDGIAYCTCPAWKFHTKGKERTCKHLKAFERITFSNPDFEPYDGMEL